MNLAVDEYLLKPYAHVVVFLAVTVFVLVRSRDANAVYTRAGVVYTIFILANSILLFFVQNTWSYFITSLLFSVIYLVAASLLCSMYIKLAKVEGSGESAMIFLVIIYHPVALLLVIALKWLVG